MPKRPFKKTITVVEISSSSEDEIVLEEPVQPNMARGPHGTVSPPTTSTSVAGPSNLFRSGLHPSALEVADSRVGQMQLGGQLLGAFRTGPPQPELVQPIAGPSGVPRIVYSRSNPEPGLAWNDESSEESSESENDDEDWETVPYEEYAPFITRFDSDGNEIKSDPEDQPEQPSAKKSRKSKPDPRKRK